MKSIDEASKEFAKKWCLNDKLHEQIFRAGFVLCAKQFAQRWIPVEEEMPNFLTDVLLRLSNGKIAMGCLMDGGFNEELKDDRFKVTHWRPIELK